MYTAGMCPVLDYVLFPGDGIKYGTTFQLSNFCLSMMCVLCMYACVCVGMCVCRHTCVCVDTCMYDCLRHLDAIFPGQRWTRPAAEGGGGRSRWASLIPRPIVLLAEFVCCMMIIYVTMTSDSYPWSGLCMSAPPPPPPPARVALTAGSGLASCILR